MTSTSKPPKTVVFDVGGVLIRWDDHRVMDRAAHRLGVPRSTMRSLLLAHRPRLQAGLVDLEGFWDRISGDMGRSVPPSVRSLWWRMLEQGARPREEVLRWAAQLRQEGIRTALFSNTDASHRRFFAGPWSRGFSPRLLSYELRAVKPEPLAFRRAERRLGSPPGDLCLLDDVAANVRAAQRAGWNAHTFRNVRESRSYLRRLGWLP